MGSTNSNKINPWVLKNIPYHERLIKLGMPNLAYRRLHFDMAEVFKLVHGCDYINEINTKLFVDQVGRTKGTHLNFLNLNVEQA